MENVRKPKVAGMFYPSDPEELQSMINSFLNEVDLPDKFNLVKGIVSPHAGYIYSGKTASAAYKTVMGKNYSKVIVISPSHREYFPGISIFKGDYYQTPLGKIPINKEVSAKMVENSKLAFRGKEGHGPEHALEVQLPFLQTVLKGFSLIPIVIGDQGKMFVDELAGLLINSIDDETLVVASSDLSHFYTKQEAKRLDDIVVEHINNYNYQELQHDLDTQRCFACGGGGIVALLKAMKNIGVNNSKVIMHTDSGDVTGDDREVVGYLSAVVYN